MDFAARRPDASTIAAQQAAARRFGIALVASAVGVAVVAFGLYEVSARQPVVPFSAKQSAGIAVDHNAVGSGERYQNLLSAFAQAFERDDEVALRAVYPTMNDRDARTLHSLRRRLGVSTMSVDNLRLRTATPQEVQIDFTVVASKANRQQARLPFAATIGRVAGDWRIEELH